MPVKSSLVAVVLVITSLAGVIKAQSLGLPSLRSGHPAGCHSSVPPRPFAPPNYQCCANGHDWAIPGAYSPDQPIHEIMAIVSGDAYHLNDTSFARPALLFSATETPPCSAPLRV